MPTVPEPHLMIHSYRSGTHGGPKKSQDEAYVMFPDSLPSVDALKDWAKDVGLSNLSHC